MTMLLHAGNARRVLLGYAAVICSLSVIHTRRQSDWGHLQFRASDLNEGRKRAREEAAIAKAAGFEWVNVSV